MTSYSGQSGRGAGNPLPLVPPNNFSAIAKHIYRSAYPREANVPYLRHIGIRTIVLLSIEALPAGVLKALKDTPEKKPSTAGGGGGGSSTTPVTPLTSGTPSTSQAKGKQPQQHPWEGASAVRDIRIVELANMSSWRVDCLNENDDFSQQDVTRALDFAVDVQWHPVLFCCPLGELQTSVVTGCMRRYQGWCLAAIFGECELFANLQPNLRPSVMNFIEAWRPEEYPISMTDIVQRNREWLKERAQQGHQHRRRQRRLMRQQQQGGSAAGSSAHSHHRSHHHIHASHPLRGSEGSSVAVSSSRASEYSMSSSGDESDAHTDASTLSSTFGLTAHAGESRVAVANTQAQPPQSSTQQQLQQQQQIPPPLTALGGENAQDEAALPAGSGARPPSTWQRRPRPHVVDERGSFTPSTTGERDEDAISPAQYGAPFSDSPCLTFQDKCTCDEVVYADWFEEARRRNPACCIDARAWSHRMFSLEAPMNELDAAEEEGETEGSWWGFPKSAEDVSRLKEPPPHIRYAGVRNPPVLDERSTFTKQSIVDEDDD